MNLLKQATCLIDMAMDMDMNISIHGIFLLKPYASQAKLLQLHYVIISEMCLVEIQGR